MLLLEEIGGSRRYRTNLAFLSGHVDQTNTGLCDPHHNIKRKVAKYHKRCRVAPSVALIVNPLSFASCWWWNPEAIVPPLWLFCERPSGFSTHAYHRPTPFPSHYRQLSKPETIRRQIDVSYCEFDLLCLRWIKLAKGFVSRVQLTDIAKDSNCLNF